MILEVSSQALLKIEVPASDYDNSFFNQIPSKKQTETENVRSKSL